LLRRRLLQVAGALAAILRPTAVFAEPDDEGERLGPFGPWSTPINLGPVVHTQYLESHPAISTPLSTRGAVAQIGAPRQLRSLPLPGTNLVRPPDCRQTRIRMPEDPPRVEPTNETQVAWMTAFGAKASPYP
jgi:hypothetical protein